ncbi:hypothetical protein [Streptomyces sp. NBC_00271]|uniref:hypothetical protein n=1 Tax=Streptomyces sp. NBC_00271 TaxID=2975697 RepID=UPI002E2E0986|nr:hypothetical protein [Streptomyces sp. NBC_00271]
MLVDASRTALSATQALSGEAAQFVETPGADEAPYGRVVQPQLAADRGQGFALGQQLLHRRVPLGGAGLTPYGGHVARLT